MGLKNLCVAILGVMLLAWNSSSGADEYRADEFLGLDLSRALLSPKPLGPVSHFAPVAIEARTEGARPVHATTVHASTERARTERATADRTRTGGKRVAAHARMEPKSHARIADVKPVVRKADIRPANVAQVRPERPRGAARTKLAHRHVNLLDAQAQDTRIQTWPCRSGGICNWK